MLFISIKEKSFLSYLYIKKQNKKNLRSDSLDVWLLLLRWCVCHCLDGPLTACYDELSELSSESVVRHELQAGVRTWYEMQISVNTRLVSVVLNQHFSGWSAELTLAATFDMMMVNKSRSVCDFGEMNALHGAASTDAASLCCYFHTSYAAQTAPLRVRSVVIST